MQHKQYSILDPRTSHLILCEELKLKIVKILRLYDLFFNPRPLEATLAPSNLLDPHIWYSGCWIWPRPQMASGGLEQPQKFKTEAKVKFDILRSGQGIWVSYTGGLGGLRSLEWPQAASDWKRGRTASKFFEVATIFNFSSSHKICAL